MRKCSPLVVGLVVVAACSASAKHPSAPPASTTSTTTTAPVRRASLEFREVARTGTARVVGGHATCAGATLTDDAGAGPPPSFASRPVVIPDRLGTTCYALGPVLVTGADVGSASPLYDSTQKTWSVNLHFANNHFLTRIARPLVLQEVAVVLDGAVISAPVINPGITGADVEISGSFSRGEVFGVTASIMGVPVSKVRATSP